MRVAATANHIPCVVSGLCRRERRIRRTRGEVGEFSERGRWPGTTPWRTRGCFLAAAATHHERWTRHMNSGSILVADDDAAIRTVLNQALSRAGYEVRTTGNAATLWRWVTQGDGDLVITDVVMPDEDAFDLIPRIRKARPELPTLVIGAQN